MMTVSIPAEFQEFVHGMIQDGSYGTEAEVVGEALRLLKKREELRRDVNAGVEQLDEGKGIDSEEVFERLQRKAEDIARQATPQDQ